MIIINFIWYPKCSTCKRAKEYLNKRNIKYEERDIVLDKLSYREIENIIEKSGKDIKSLFNTSGLKYRELGLKDKLNNISFDEKIKLLSSDGMLVKRPILIDDNFVLIGFKEKEWSGFFENN